MKVEDEFPTCKETYCTLNVFSDNLIHEIITKKMAIEPTRYFNKGDIFSKNNLKRKHTGWFFSSKGKILSNDNGKHIDWLLDVFYEKKSILEEIRIEGAEIEISSFWLSRGQGGPLLNHEQMKKLAEMKINIWWDVYFSDDE